MCVVQVAMGQSPMLGMGVMQTEGATPMVGAVDVARAGATVGSMQGATVSPASMQLLYCDVM